MYLIKVASKFIICGNIVSFVFCPEYAFKRLYVILTEEDNITIKTALTL
jgi:hypothetical protein